MKTRWIIIVLSREVRLAVAVEEVLRVLHRADPEFELFEPEGRSLSDVLEVPADPALPGVILLTAKGDCWLVGDATLDGPGPDAVFLTLPPYLLRNSPPWCKGILWGGEDRYAYVSSLEALGTMSGAEECP